MYFSKGSFWLMSTAILFSLSFSSCLTLIGKKIGVNKAPVVETIENNSKTIVFLGVAHLGTPDYYNQIRAIVATYQQQYYTFFVESVSRYGETGKDTVAMKKLRKLLGVDVSVKYANMDNPILQSLIKKYNLQNQPWYTDLGIRNFTIADVTYPELVQVFEKRYGTEVLDDCNRELPLGVKYVCSPTSKARRKLFHNEIVLNYRNQKVSEMIKADSSKKVFIIFGRDHFKGIKSLLANEK